MMRRIDVPWAIGIAIAIVSTLVVTHVVGGRDAVSVLSGTPPDGSLALMAPLGVLYALSWLASILIAPPLVLAGALEWALRRAHGPTSRQASAVRRQ